ncbi:MAG: hypothetical protein LBK25_07910 [Treponema sp.]|jgi:hypothetical protein|nr:hypothetical protein [Treponema sp.]
MKRLFLVGLVLFFGSSALVFAQEQTERRRGLYLDVGLGLGGVSYFNGDTKAKADYFNNIAKSRETTDSFLLAIGWALTQDVYLVWAMSTVDDDYADAQLHRSQITINLWGVGARYYPLPSKKYLQLGLDVGLSRMVTTYYMQDIPDSSDGGLSGRLSVACDFDTTMTGLTVLLGGSLMMNIIENDTSLAYALFFKLAFK